MQVLMRHSCQCPGSRLRTTGGSCSSIRAPAAPVHHGFRRPARSCDITASATNGSRTFNKRSEPDFPAFPVDETFPDEALATNKYQDSSLDANEALKSICAWDTEGLPKHHTSRRGVSNKVMLSTYADCIGSNIADLTGFLQAEVQDAIGSIHLLPIFPSTGDRGFAPVNYQEVDPQLGSWGDVQTLAGEYQMCLEYMVNHISPGSPQFQDYKAHGDNSAYKDMFVRWKDVWASGAPTAEELAMVRTRKPAPPVLSVEMGDGSVVPLWCTFSTQQVDIDPFSEKGWEFTEASLRSLCERGGARLIRLDAFGYVSKKAGTTCFMQGPEVWDLLARIKEVVRPYGVQLLCEVHEDFLLNIELARHGLWVYDFALPLLMLHALKFKSAEPLRHWISICPRRQITTLDTHDGMGVDDITGLAPLVDIPELERSILGRGGNINYKHFFVKPGQADVAPDHKRTTSSLHAAADFLQPDCLEGSYQSVAHQYNQTYFSAVGEDPQQYLLARAIQFFTPGVPMIYYVGLLAGSNDFEQLQNGGDCRDINRHFYSLQEARQAVRRPVVQALLELCRFRNEHPAFKGRVYVDDSGPASLLKVTWDYKGLHKAVLVADVASHAFSISHTPYSPDGLELGGVSSLDARGIFSVFSCDALDLPSRKLKRTRAMVAAAAAAAGAGVAEGSVSESDTEGSVSVGVGMNGMQQLDLSWAWKTAPAAASR
ncbi:hypothetical protein OEZ85_013369 [Tetradesmus obliquus]|uniref:Glycosyl hydrolase family 13 catalytic domain-containing protein n=1 Tax=Tetradesmus obliquus TaxID=3088 RepID=A0ABY8U6I1_TETOB|nr:hypothetical protein OEZ85_013369 [Tetradesmus obliquus]